jgi:type IV secretory pathway TrbL component
LFGGGYLSTVIGVAESGSLLSAGADIAAMALKATRSGVGGPKTPYASGFNMIGRWAVRNTARATGSAPANVARFVQGVNSIRNTASPALLIFAAGTTAYNTTIALQCRRGWIGED